MSSVFDAYQKGRLNRMSKPEEVEQDSPPAPGDPQAPSEFERDLESLINRHSLENASGTPDFILAAYLQNCLNAFNTAVRQRGNWRGESVELPSLQRQKSGIRSVPLAIFDEHGHRNEVGVAAIQVWPGEDVKSGLITEVKAIFENER
jgi:hypothetical protein